MTMKKQALLKKKDKKDIIILDKGIIGPDAICCWFFIWPGK